MNSKGDASKKNWQDFTIEKLVNFKIKIKIQELCSIYSQDGLRFRMSDDLYNLVNYRSHQLEKPFVYVGAEMGALVARFYTSLNER